MKGHPRFLALLEQMKATHIAKGSDYSNPSDILSNLRECEEIGVPAWLGVVIRMCDKFERIKQLSRKQASGEGPAVANEAMEDTLIDAASYCLLTIVLREESKGV